MRDMFWALYLLSLASVGAFGLGMFCLLRPMRILAIYRWAWARGAQLARTPAILDEAEARIVGVMFVVGALILAGSTFIPR